MNVFLNYKKMEYNSKTGNVTIPSGIQQDNILFKVIGR